jgi:hypothetical protein
MGWSIGYDSHWERDIGYGVPAYCDHPDCNKKIDRGLGYVCGGEPYGGEHGCGLYFCGQHQVGYYQRCERCAKKKRPFPAKPDHPQWVRWKLKDKSWKQWRDENPDSVAKLMELVKPAQNATAHPLSPSPVVGEREGV